MNPIMLVAKLAEDVVLQVSQLTPSEQTAIASLSRQAQQICALMAIVEPTDPNEPSPEPDDFPPDFR